MKEIRFAPWRNGQNVDEGQIPVLETVNELTDVLAREMEEGRRLAAYFGRRLDGRIKIYALLADDEDGRLWMVAAWAADSFPSLATRFPQTHLFEREIHEQFGLVPVGHPWLKPVRAGSPDDVEFFRVDQLRQRHAVLGLSGDRPDRQGLYAANRLPV